jgi:benzodiazapine receptor
VSRPTRVRLVSQSAQAPVAASASAYTLVWTPPYVTIAYAAARTLTRAPSRDRRQLADGLILDLALNAAWTPLFFRGRRPRAALAEIA